MKLQLKSKSKLVNRRSRPARGAWVEIRSRSFMSVMHVSRPARGAWVEIMSTRCFLATLLVAPREGRVG